MASRTYQNFDLLLEAAEGDSFRARVTTSPLGECPSGKFTLPFDATQLENLLLKLDPGRSGTRRAGSDPQSQASMDLGGPLFESVFSEDIMLTWQRSQDYARDHGDGLRLRLRLTDAPSIAGLPWELLYDRRGNSFIAQSERTPVVRYLEVPQPPRPLMVDGALRILVVISSPTDLPELDVEAEWRRVQDALAAKVAEGTVKIDRLPAPTIQALSAWLRQNDVHILHFIGHGDYDDRIQDGVVYFQDRYGRSTKVSPTVLGPTFATTTRCGSSCSTPASRRASTAPTRSAGWRRASSSRTAPRSSRCSSPSRTARRRRSPVSSTARSPTASRSTRRPPAPARRSSRSMRRSGPPRCCSSALRTVACSTTSWPSPP